LVVAANFLVAATKKLFVVPNFVAGTKPFFSVIDESEKACSRGRVSDQQKYSEEVSRKRANPI